MQFLYLEDELRDVELVNDRLKRTDLEYVLRVAHDRDEFEELIRSQSFDLILADYQLPSFNGMEALAYARQLYPDIPFILISGVLGEEQAVDCVLQGATDYVLKSHLDRIVSSTLRALREAEDKKGRLQAEADLRASEARYRDIVETANEGIWVVDGSGQTLLNNRRLVTLLGYSEAQLGSLRPQDLVLPGFSLDRLLEPRRGPAGPPIEVGLRHSSGSELTVLVSASSPSASYGDGITLMLTDVSELKTAAQERFRLEEKLIRAAKMESLGTMAGGIAHDMNNVLGAILGLAAMHRDFHPAESETHQAFDRICKAAIRGAEMVKKLLAFARLQPEKQQILDLNELLTDEIHFLQHTALAKVRVNLHLAPNLRPVCGDASSLANAFMNLCVNAADAMPEGGKLTIASRNLPEDETEISFSDTGTGMTAEVLQKAMDPFFTTKALGKGTGLGLSMVYSTMKSHRGRVELTSVLGKGTEVVLTFPKATTENLI